jgi:putative transposase
MTVLKHNTYCILLSVAFAAFIAVLILGGYYSPRHASRMPGTHTLHMLRRHRVLDFKGGTHFITTVTATRGNWFIEDAICTEILKIFEGYRSKFGLHCLGYILMPDHLHALLHQEESGSIVSDFMEAFKGLTSKKCRPHQYADRSLWRRRYDDVPIPGPNAARTRIEYIHENPVRRGLVEHVENYPWSSARDYLELSSGIVQLLKI